VLKLLQASQISAWSRFDFLNIGLTPVTRRQKFNAKKAVRAVNYSCVDSSHFAYVQWCTYEAGDIPKYVGSVDSDSLSPARI
jgi:hypothetical protein